MKNCIIVSVGLKGGGGKSTVCANLAMHLIDQGIPVIFYDADIQQTLVRQRELAEHPMSSHLNSWCHSVQNQCHWGALWEDSEGSCHRQMLEKYGIVTACIKHRVKWSVTALSSIMTLTSVLSECISKKVVMLRQNSATPHHESLLFSHIIYNFARKTEIITR